MTNSILSKLTEVEYDLLLRDNPELIQEINDNANKNLFLEKTNMENELSKYQNIKETLIEDNNIFNKDLKKINSEYEVKKDNSNKKFLSCKEKIEKELEKNKLEIDQKYKENLDVIYSSNLKQVKQVYKDEIEKLESSYSKDIGIIQEPFDPKVIKNYKYLSDEIKLIVGELYKTQLNDIYLAELIKEQDDLKNINEEYAKTLDNYNKEFSQNKKISENNSQIIEEEYNLKYNSTQDNFKKKLINYNNYLLYKFEILKVKTNLEDNIIKTKKLELEETLNTEYTNKKQRIKEDIEKLKEQTKANFDLNNSKNINMKKQDLEKLEIEYNKNNHDLEQKIQEVHKKLDELDTELNKEKKLCNEIYENFKEKITENQYYLENNIDNKKIIKNILDFKDAFMLKNKLNFKNEHIKHFNEQINAVISESGINLENNNNIKLYLTNKQNKFLLGFEGKTVNTENFKIDNKNEHTIYKPVYIDDLNIDKNEAILFIYDDHGGEISETNKNLNKSYYSMLESIIISVMFKASKINYELKIIDKQSIPDVGISGDFLKENLKILDSINTDKNLQLKFFDIIGADSISNLDNIKIENINPAFKKLKDQNIDLNDDFENFVLEEKYNNLAFKRIILSIRMYYDSKNKTITLADLDKFFKLILSKGILPIILLSKTDFDDNYLNLKTETDKSNIKESIKNYCNGKIYFIENLHIEEDIIKLKKFNIEDYK